MEIENNTSIDYSVFGEVPEGSVFIYNDMVYFKVRLGAASPFWPDEYKDSIIAVNLEGNHLETFSSEDRVIIVNATLTLRN